MTSTLRAGLLGLALLVGGTRAPAAAPVVVMHGPVDQASLTLWVQTAGPGRVSVTVHPEADPAPARRVEGEPRAEDDYALHLRLAGLAPGAAYRYQVLVDGAPAADGAFRTQPLWQFRGDPPDVAIAFGSCAYLNDRYDRPGSPWGGDYGIFDAIAATAPDLMLWLGDNVYLREPEWTSIEGMSARYRAQRAMPELRALLRATSHVAIWDDHDFGPDDSDGSFTLKGDALAVFERYWANPSYGLPGVPGIFGKVALADVDVFLLDNRFHRYPNRYPPTADKAMFGPAQLEWLRQALVSSRATFKVIVAGGQLWNARNRFEAFHRFPAEQKALADWIGRQRIEGVLFLTGDRHFSELLRVERPGTYPFYEFTSSPLTAGVFADPPPEERQNPALVPGTLVTQRSFGVLRVSGPREARRLTLEARDARGERLWRREIASRELR